MTALAAAKGSIGESELALLMGDGVGERLTDSMGEKVFSLLEAGEKGFQPPGDV